MSEVARRLKHWIGLDRAIAFNVLGKAWSVLAGVVILGLVTRKLSPAEQGYYYTFNSVMALQILFELGFSFVILQFASHERVHLSISNSGAVTGDPIAHCRLASILQKSVRWYFTAAVLMGVALLPGGWLFFTTQQRPGVHANWQAPWFCLGLLTLLAFQVTPLFSFLEGCGYVPQVAHVRLWQAAAGTTMACVTLFFGFGLYAPAALVGGQALVGLVSLTCWRKLISSLLHHASAPHIVHFREIWPFQWRIALSWFCGFFIFQAINPILFMYQGPVAAGRMGMSLAIIFALSATSLTWMNTKAQPFGSMVARRQFADLDRLFFRTLKQSTAMLFAFSATFFACLFYATQAHPQLAGRVVPLWDFSLLLGTTFVTHIAGCQALYLRAHKQEPFLMPTVLSAIMVLSSTYFAARSIGLHGVVIGYAGCAVVGICLGTYVFLKKRREWHAAKTGEESIPTLVPAELPGGSSQSDSNS